ncbi:hypothetical protein DCMF_18515 [Candidatus Formimonas warabiya]|uniref:TRAP C4-dicarboxylate transport system permease DctM subunit domain-containing protein n=2 Tax=Formimonas warabiya TaxID=1761012 RepID=A0A3G1KVK8_FORW1|nr:hypothetical protein DCMF_18515 [Candidatus Formimonas warabiya]
MGAILKNLFVESGEKRKLGQRWKMVSRYFAIVFALYLLYSNLVYYPDLIILRSVFVAGVLALGFIWYTMPGEDPAKPIPVRDIVCAILCLAIGIYVVANGERFITRYAFFDALQPLDYFFGVITILLTLEATRRIVGPLLMWVDVIALLYPFFGKYIPGLFGSPGFDVNQVAEMSFMTTGGIFGSSVGTAATYVFIFCIFGAVMTETGVGEFFFEIATKVAGNFRGGLGKVAVVSSALFGSISGSPISNVLTTGNFTIPAMKKAGYPPHIAAACEAAAASGGTILPPVMGSVAFVMAEIIGWKYRDVMIAGIVPGLLYFLAVFIAVDAVAVKYSLRGMSRDLLPKLSVGMEWLPKAITLFVPMFWLVYRIMVGYTAIRAAAEASLMILVFSLLIGGKKRITFKGLLNVLDKSIKDVIMVGVACAGAGIIIGMTVLTGVGAKITSTLMILSDGSIMLALVLTAIITLILGLGMSITPTYILAASLCAPGLISIGVPLICAHMFIVYFSAMGTMTPPVALTAFTAAGIAGSEPQKTGWIAFRFALCAYIIPFVFAYRPELLLQLTGASIPMTLLFVTIGVITMSFTIAPVFISDNKLYHRIILGIATFLLFVPNYGLNLIGLGVFAIVIILKLFQKKKTDRNTEPMAVNL